LESDVRFGGILGNGGRVGKLFTLRLLFGKWLFSVRGGAGWPEPLLFRLFRFDFDKRLVGGSLCPVCPERTDSLSIFTQLVGEDGVAVRR
jgi:hypothetical protein